MMIRDTLYCKLKRSNTHISADIIKGYKVERFADYVISKIYPVGKEEYLLIHKRVKMGITLSLSLLWEEEKIAARVS